MGLAFLQHDSLQCLVVWQYFLFVLTTPCLKTVRLRRLRILYDLRSPASHEFHQTRALVDVAVAAANWTVLRGQFAVDGAVLAVGAYVVARAQMGERDAHPRKKKQLGGFIVGSDARL